MKMEDPQVAMLSLDEAIAFLDDSSVCDPETSPDRRSASSSPQTSSEALTPVPSPPALPAPRPKKRVRRQQLELRYLRELAGKLEHRLDQMKRHRSKSKVEQRGGASDPAAYRCRFEGRKSTSVWEGIADRQFKDRMRAEKQNHELKMAVDAQIKLGRGLDGRLRKGNQTALAVVELQHEKRQFWDFTAEDEDGILADLLAVVVRMRIQLERQQIQDPRTGVRYTWGVTLGEPHLKTDGDAGLMLEAHENLMLPFNLESTAMACWRIPLGMVGIHSRDAQIQKTGWVKVRRAEGQQCTTVEMHSEMKPRFRTDAVDQEGQTQALMEWVRKSHEVVNDWYNQTFSDLLVEEDWKSFQG
ncbi:hypothetical protein BBJ28_00014569 [Nothophytophthora sp. Chile5]|nr:hypothetical protein BBJ28_00014569 [Nothophytophthora sp. Chile5]